MSTFMKGDYVLAPLVWAKTDMDEKTGALIRAKVNDLVSRTEMMVRETMNAEVLSTTEEKTKVVWWVRTPSYGFEIRVDIDKDGTPSMPYLTMLLRVAP